MYNDYSKQRQSNNMTDSPKVKLASSAILRGKISKSSASDRNVYTFLGVPFAMPPVGKLRFKPPQTMELWDGIRDATEHGAACPQDDSMLPMFGQLIGLAPRAPDSKSEDCLYLDVFSPTLDQDAKLPVMVYIHGGGYMAGSGSWHTPMAMSSLQDVVIVSINYRLGPLGFLSTGDDVMPGNYGMLDQIEALKWVQSYIGNFGGDKDNVTIFGESAGSMSVSLLILIEKARGLFHKAICQSGTAFSCDCIITKETAREKLMEKIKDLGCDSTSSADILEHLQTVPADDLITNYKSGQQPIIDGTLIPQDIETLYSSGNFAEVPLMLGVCSDEGAIMVFPKLMMTNSKLDTLDKATEMLREFGYFKKLKSSHDVDGLIEALMKEYIPSQEELAITQGVAEIIADYMYVVPTIQAINYHQEKSNVYLYLFDHRPSWSPNPEWVKADHSSDIPYFFGMGFVDWPDVTFTDEEREFQRKLVEMEVNFARTGNPTPDSSDLKWPEHKAKREYIRLNPNPSLETDMKPEKYTFWCKALEEYKNI